MHGSGTGSGTGTQFVYVPCGVVEHSPYEKNPSKDNEPRTIYTNKYICIYIYLYISIYAIFDAMYSHLKNNKNKKPHAGKRD